MAAFNPPTLSTTVAYVDPGTGSLVIQMAIGALVGGLVMVKVFWKRITGFCKNLVGGRPKHDEHSN
ncbi:MAG: hypothetical protein HYX79_07400 [Chloroflexi bacterium]|nr:hypothetical protein [Chloroflexota bacterium]